MTDTAKALKRLKALAEMALNAELAKLSAIQTEKSGAEAQLKALETARVERGRQVARGNGFDEAASFGADQKWRDWAENKRVIVLADLAKISARQEEQLIKTRRAFGKKEALNRIAERLNHQSKS